jgi:hypothetical protein
MYQPLDPVLTCRHLETRALAERHRWYPACALGDAEARRRWVRDLGVVRLDKIRALQRRLGLVIQPFSGELWRLKGRQLRAFRDGRDTEVVTGELRTLTSQMGTETDAFINGNTEAFSEVGMPADAARHLLHIALERFVEMQFASEVSFEVPDEALQRFPESVRIFFRPVVFPQPQPAP